MVILSVEEPGAAKPDRGRRVLALGEVMQLCGSDHRLFLEVIHDGPGSIRLRVYNAAVAQAMESLGVAPGSMEGGAG